MKTCHRSEVAKTDSWTVIDPYGDGVEGTARVCVYDPILREYRQIVPVPSGHVVVHDHSEFEPLLTYRVDRLVDGRWQTWRPMAPLIPKEFRAPQLEGVTELEGGLAYTVRRDVTISPYVSLGRSRVPQGFRSVYSCGKFVAESLRLTMGRQLDFPGPEVPASDHQGRRVIFGDVPNSGFGHFLTEGLARLWFAKMNPDLPIVWLSRLELSDMQKTIMEFVGITNEQVFLERPIRFDEVVFPLPGVCIGDFLLPGQVNFLGVFEARKMIPSRRIYLSRRSLPGERGKSSVEQDIEVALTEQGYEVFCPEQYSLEEQLAAISSAEIVVGVEGSALHLPLLIKDPVKTAFFAIGRHRLGGGLFEHTRHVKKLNYTTLNFLQRPDKQLVARDPLTLDIEAFRQAVTATSGFSSNLGALDAFRVAPSVEDRSYPSALRGFRIEPSVAESDLFMNLLDVPRVAQDQRSRLISDVYGP